MRLVADENISRTTINLLRARGYRVTSIARTKARGADDEVVLQAAHRRGAILITADRDFGRLVVLESHQLRKLVLLRPGAADATLTAEAIELALTALHDVEEPAIAVADLRRDGVRIRIRQTRS